MNNDRSTPPKVVLSIVEMEALLEAPGEDVVGLRDRAILETLYSTGLRRSELCSLDCYDLDFAEGIIRVRNGKGGRERFVPVGEVAIAALRRYQRQSRPFLLAGRADSALFVANVTHRRLEPKHLNWMVFRYTRTAGITRRVSPHVLRHTCATHLLQGGAAVTDVQAILGHVCLGSTPLYTRVTVEDLIAVHERTHPRDRMRVS